MRHEKMRSTARRPGGVSETHHMARSAAKSVSELAGLEEIYFCRRMRWAVSVTNYDELAARRVDHGANDFDR